MNTHVTAELLKDLYVRSANSGHGEIQMLELAGFQLASFVSHRYPARTHKNVLVICGGGNNGAGGFSAAKHLINNDHNVVVYRASQDLTEAGNHNFNILKNINANFTDNLDFSFSDIIVDCLVGHGLKGDLSEYFQQVVKSINDSTAINISLDMPSGVNPDTGDPSPVSVYAEHTVVLGVEKIGNQNKDFNGVVHVYDIGIPKKFYSELEIEYPF